MASLAKITLIGNLGGDPEVRHSPEGLGMTIARFSIAVNNRARGGQPETTSWYRCSCFGKLAETVVNLAERGYLTKGKQVYIDGNFEPREFESKAGGTKTVLEVNVRELQLLGQRGDDTDNEPIPF